MKRKAIVCDIDGVLLNSQFILDEIHKLGLKGEEKWEYFYEHCNSNRVEVIEETKKFLDTIDSGYYVTKENIIDGFDSYTHCDRQKYIIIISTARNEKCRTATEDKLFYEHIGYDKMYMRKDGDLRPACEVKREHLLQIMEEFDVIAFIDDDLQNCEMAKSLGILSLRRV